MGIEPLRMPAPGTFAASARRPSSLLTSRAANKRRLQKKVVANATGSYQRQKDNAARRAGLDGDDPLSRLGRGHRAGANTDSSWLTLLPVGLFAALFLVLIGICFTVRAYKCGVAVLLLF